MQKRILLVGNLDVFKLKVKLGKEMLLELVWIDVGWTAANSDAQPILSWKPLYIEVLDGFEYGIVDLQLIDTVPVERVGTPYRAHLALLKLTECVIVGHRVVLEFRSLELIGWILQAFFAESVTATKQQRHMSLVVEEVAADHAGTNFVAIHSII